MNLKSKMMATAAESDIVDVVCNSVKDLTINGENPVTNDSTFDNKTNGACNSDGSSEEKVVDCEDRSVKETDPGHVEYSENGSENKEDTAPTPRNVYLFIFFNAFDIVFSISASSAPQRGAEVRQLALPIQPANLDKHQTMGKKDIATVTSPVEIKPIKIGDPKTRSKISFEVITARVIESGGKHVVSILINFKS